MIKLITAFAALFCQDPAENVEEIVATLPSKYLEEGFASVYFAPFTLRDPPEYVKRYCVTVIFENSDFVSQKRISKEEFYDIARKVLGFGVWDGRKFIPNLNKWYRDFVKLLLKKGIVTESDLQKLAGQYRTAWWVESLYWLDEALPGVVSRGQWQALSYNSLNEYSQTLIGLKLGIAPQEIYKEVIRMQVNFFEDAKLYAELERKGAQISSEIQAELFKSYLEFCKERPSDYLDMKYVYNQAGLSFPSAEVASAALSSYFKEDQEFPTQAIPVLRKYHFSFPKEAAARYRDSLLQLGGNLEDIEYMVEMAGEDAKPSLWKRYGDHYYWWFGRKENRMEQGDYRDYYHLAVTAYQRASKLGLKLSREKIQQLLKAIDDLSVRMIDIIAVYEMAEVNPKTNKDVLEILENRADSYNESPFLVGMTPFRDEIELAFYLKDSQKIQKVTRKIVAFVRSEFGKEGGSYFRIFEETPATLRDLILLNLQFYYDDNSEFCTIFKELKMAIDLYESLGFVEGARCLAEDLLGSGFVIQARRAYAIAGLKKEADEQLYSKEPEKYWIEYERKVVARLRWKGFLKN